MALTKGQPAPDFRLKGTGNTDFHLHRDMQGKAFILFFYPKNFTPGCTIEACGFRDHFEAFRDLEIEVIGISRDKIDSHERFKNQYNLPFLLLSDPDGEVMRRYVAKMPFLSMSKRISYLIGPDLRIAAVYENLLDGGAHIREMIRATALKSPQNN
jgi:thioredoxin-dependent peroxiredoxin